MERMLQKMARQLNAMDEASLMALWDKDMADVRHFDGSAAWEESVIVLALIQAVRGKNRLFNAYLELAQENAPAGRGSVRREASGENAGAQRPPRKGKIIPFRPL